MSYVAQTSDRDPRKQRKTMREETRKDHIDRLQTLYCDDVITHDTLEQLLDVLLSGDMSGSEYTEYAHQEYGIRQHRLLPDPEGAKMYL